MEASAQKRIFDEIDTLEPQLVEELRRLVSIPSVSGSLAPCERCAAAVGELCAGAGFDVELWSSHGSPVVFAELAAPPGAPTVLFYGHYDVQPADPVDAWQSPPFSPEIRNGAMYGRGTGDNKGQFIAHIFAARALQATIGSPVGVKLLIEGEEEYGSPNLADLVVSHADRLSCDVAITADGPYLAEEVPLIVLGVRGLLFLEVAAQGAQRDLHSGSNGGIAPTPARRLVRGLASMWNRDGAVDIDGFYDDVIGATAEEDALIEQLPPPQAGSSPSRDPVGAWRTLMFEPNVNIAGIKSGYGGPGVKTIVPHRASAKIDIRLVADQNPEHIAELMRRHLAAARLDVEILSKVPPSRTPLSSPFVAPVRQAIAAAWGRRPLVQPRLGGTTPDFVFTRELGVPSLLVPYAPPDMHHHAPDERMSLEALSRGVRTSAAICMAIGNSSAEI